MPKDEDKSMFIDYYIEHAESVDATLMELGENVPPVIQVRQCIIIQAILQMSDIEVVTKPGFIHLKQNIFLLNFLLCFCELDIA